MLIARIGREVVVVERFAIRASPRRRIAIESAFNKAGAAPLACERLAQVAAATIPIIRGTLFIMCEELGVLLSMEVNFLKVDYGDYACELA